MAEVGVAQLRRNLREWVARAQAGEEIVLTDRNQPVARLTGIALPVTLQRLIDEGRVSRPRRDRPYAQGVQRVHAQRPVSDYVVTEREDRRG
ncbi:MAG: type II toxin-antitoxin system Phd/YefM family antitoxin [Egibacteraceae bacterium]